MTEEEYKKKLEDISNSDIIGSILKCIVPVIMLIWVGIIVAGIIWLIINF